MADVIVNVGFKEDASVNDVIDHLSTVKSTIEEIGDNKDASAAFLEQMGLSDKGRQEIIDTLADSIKSLQSIGPNLSSIPTHLQQSFSTLKTEVVGIEEMLNNIGNKQQSITSDSMKSMRAVSGLMMSTAAINSQATNMSQYNKDLAAATSGKDGTIGWSKQQHLKYSNSVMPFLDSSARKILASSSHGVTSEGLINQVANDKFNTDYIRNIARNVGVELTREQAVENIKLYMRGNSDYIHGAGAGETLGNWKARGVYNTRNRPVRVEDRFSNDNDDYQKMSFAGFGRNDYAEKMAAQYVAAGHKTRTYNGRKGSDLYGLHSFLGQEGNMDELFPVLKELGIATVNGKGEYEIYSKLQETQLQKLRARALQEYHKALRSDAPYEADPTQFLNAGQMTHRQGVKPSLWLGLNNALPESVIPSLAGTIQETEDKGGKIKVGTKIGKTPTLSRYYIPQTDINFQTGAATVRNNNWRKDLSLGIEQRDDDEFVAITDSLIARMFGMQGNRSLGFGNDEKTGAIKRYDENGKALNPNMFTADFSKFITYDEKAGEYIVDKTDPDYRRAESILSGKELVDYGGEKYRALYTKSDGRVIFGKNDIAKQIDERFESAHLPSIFNFGNDREGGIFFQGDNTRTIKQINALSKMASSGTLIEDLMGQEQIDKLQQSAGIYANFEMLYDILDGMEKTGGGKYTGKWNKIMGRRMDGLAFGDPTIFNRDFQGRFAGGTDKFAMGAYDWRPMLLKGWEEGHKLNPRLYGYDETYDPNYNGPNAEAYRKSHRAVFVPTGGANKEDRPFIEEYITGKKADGTDLTQAEIEDRQRRFFTNAAASTITDADGTVRNVAYIMDKSSQKGGLAFRTMDKKHFFDETTGEGFFTKKDYEQAVKDNRVGSDGQVVLLPWQQERYKRVSASLAAPGYVGMVEMKNEVDMQNEKNFIPESVLRAVNAPASVFQNSERLYEQKLKELNTTAGRIKQFQNDPNAMEAIDQDASWVWTNHEALTHIEETRRSLERNRALHKVMLNGEDERREGTVAVGTVGQLAEIMNALTGMDESAYGEFKSLLPSFMEGKNAVFSKGVSAKTIDMLGRFPWASGQYLMDVENWGQAAEVSDYFDTMDELRKKSIQRGRLKKAERNNPNGSKERFYKLQDLDQEIGELSGKIQTYQGEMKADPNSHQALRAAIALQKSGRDPREINSMIMTAGQIYSMNTGDFDGDTVNAFIGLSDAFKENARKELSDVRAQIQANRESRLRQQEQPEEPQTPFENLGDATFKALAQAQTATQKMAVASAAIRKAQTADINEADRVAALAEGMEAYDQATSDVKTKNAKFQLGKFAEKYLYSQGAHYDRFLKSITQAENDPEADIHNKGSIFKFSPVGMTDPIGLMAMSMRHSNTSSVLGDDGQFHNGIFDLDSYEKLESWYRSTYGVDNGYGAQAARFMLDQLEKNVIWGKLTSQEDINKGRETAQNWRSKLDAQKASGYNVDEEYSQLEDFTKRLGEMSGPNSATVENVRAQAELYEKMAAEAVPGRTKNGYLQYAKNLRRMLPENETEEERNTREGYIKTQLDSRRAERKRIHELTDASKDQQDLDDIVQTTRINGIIKAAKGETSKSIYNWSNLKHFIGASNTDESGLVMPSVRKINLSNVIDENGRIKRDANGQIIGEDVPRTVDYYKSAADFNQHMRDMIYTESGEKSRTEAYQNPMTHIGQLMHAVFEGAKDPSEIAAYKGQENAENFYIQSFRQALLGKGNWDTTGHDASVLRELGLTFKEDSYGRLVAQNAPGKYSFGRSDLDYYTGVVNNLLGTKNLDGSHSKGFMEQQFDLLRAYEKEGEEVLAVEDKLFRNGKQANDEKANPFGGNFYRQIVTDKDGNIIHTETSLDQDFKYQTKEGEESHVFRTHAKPDRASLMAPDAEGVRGIHLYDWKSSDEGSLESIPQSAFYAQMFTELAKKYYDSVEAGTPDQRYEQFKEWGHYDKNHEWQSNVRMITGVNARDGGSNYNFDLTTDAGRAAITDWAKKFDRAFLTEEALGLEGFKGAWPYLERADVVQKQMKDQVKSARELAYAPTSEFNPTSKETEFFLATYAQNKERLGQLTSDIYKEHNKNTGRDYVPNDRFSKREDELQNMFSQEMLAAVLLDAGDNDTIKKEIDDIQDRRTKLLMLNEADAQKAAVEDFTHAKTSIHQMFTGVKPTSEANAAIYAMQSIQQAARTREFLTKDEKYFKDGKFRTAENGETDTSIAAIAKARETAFMNSIAEETTANEFLDKELENYYSKYDKEQSNKIKSITKLEPEDPTEAFSNYVEKKQKQLEKEIAQYNENVRSYKEEMEKEGTSDARKAQLKRFMERDLKSAQELQNFADNNGTLQQAITEQRRYLGLDKETAAQKSDRWMNERLAVTNAAKDLALENWFNGTGSKAEYEKYVQEAALIAQQGAEMRERLERGERNEYDDFVRGVTGGQLTAAEKAQRAKQETRDRIAQKRDQYAPGTEMYNLWDSRLQDENFLNQYEQKIKQTETSNQEILARQRESQLEQLQSQNMLAEAQQKHQYEQQNRNLWGHSRSRLVNAYRQQNDMRWVEEQRYLGAVEGAARTSRDLNVWKTSFEKENGMTAAEYKEKYSKGGGDTNKLIAADQILKAEEALRHYNVTAEESKAQMEKFSKPAMALRSGFTAIGDSVNMLVQRFGRRMFQKAIQEASQFVKQYDKTMTEIQMITMKSDSEMSTVGDGLISKAKEMKISISEISQSAATLYRQGLSDEEVDGRLETISKFSKVSGTKVADATKLVTVAMNTGLVSNADEAADIVTALGDNAATNAQQIEKGIEKAGAAAAADGTTFGQLAAMLTAITSTTQIGGNVAGRTLNTIFGRMNKIGTNELIYDENGNAISGSAVAKLLQAQGISMYDESGNKRSTFDTLYALSQKWEGMSDAEQQQMANAIAGTRQYSNFAAIMQGMQEGKIDEYMELIGESSGITDKKFEVYTKSLEAALTDFKNTFDSVVQDLVDKGVIEQIAQVFGDIVTGIGEFISAAGGLEGVIGVLSTIAVLTATIRGGIVGGVAALALITGLGAAYSIGSAKRDKEEQEKYNLNAKQRYSNYVETSNRDISKREELTNRAEELGKKYDAGTITSKETDELSVTLDQLSTSFVNAGGSAEIASAGIENWNILVDAARQQTNGLKQEIDETADRMSEFALIQAKADYEAKLEEIDKNAGFNQKNLKTIQGVSITTGTMGQQYARNAYFGKGGIIDDLMEKGLSEKDIYKFLLSEEDYEKYMASFSAPNGEEIRKAIQDNFINSLENVRANGQPGAMYITGHNHNANSTAGALLMLLQMQNSASKISAFNNISANEEEIASLDALLGSMYNSPGVLASLFSDDYTWFSSLGLTQEDFIENVKNGFKNIKTPEGFVDKFNLALARIISGEDQRFAEYGNTTVKSNEAADEYLNTIYSQNRAYSNLTSIQQEYVRNKVDKRLENARNEAEIPDGYELHGSTLYDKKTNQADYSATAVYRAGGNIPYYLAVKQYGQDYVQEAIENVPTTEELEKEEKENAKPKTLGSLVSGVQLTSKDLKYVNEYAALMRAARSATNIENLDQMLGPEYTEFIQSKDTQLLSIWQDLQNGGTKYSYKDLLSYLENTVYGTSATKSQSALLSTAYSLSEMNNNRQLMGRTPGGSESLYQTIASATSRPVNWVRENYNEAVQAYQDVIDETQAQYEADVMKRVAQDFGEIDQNRVYSQAEVDEMNKRYADLGVTFSRKLPVGGRHGEGLDIQYNNPKATTKANLRDYAPVYTNVQLAGLAKQMQGMSWDEILDSNKWTDEEISAVASYSPEFARYAKMSKEQQASQEGQNLKRNYEIKFNVAGVSDLEDANKILKGTSSLLESLQKGGEVAIKAKIEFESNIYNTQQQAALLESGTTAEQAEVIASLTGLTNAQIQKDFVGSKELAQTILAQENRVTGATLDQIAVNNPEYAKTLASLYGYEKAGYGMSKEEALADINSFFGTNTSDTYYVDEETGKIYAINSDGHKREVSDAVQERYNKNISGGYVYTGNADIDRENAFFGIQRSYTNTELANAQKRILEEQLTNENAEDYNLYRTASEGLGQAGKDYMAMLEANRQAESDNKEAIYSQEELNAAKAKALAENTLSLQEAKEKDALEQARLNATTAGGAYQYGRLQYQQNNKAALAANGIYEALTTGEFKNVTELNEAVGQTQVENWKELLKSAPELANKLEELGARVTDEGVDFSGVKGAGENLASIIDYIAGLIGQSGKDLETQTIQTNADILRTAEATLEGRMNRETGMPAIQSILGGDNNVTRKMNKYIADAEKNLEQQQRDYDAAYASVPSEYRDQWAATHQRPTFDIYSSLTPLEALWAQGKVEAYSQGQQNISAQTQLAGLDQVREQLASGNYSNWANNQDQTALHDITNGFDEYIRAIVEAGDDTEKFNEAMKNFDDAVNAKRAEEAVKLSKATQGLGETLAGIKKGGSDGVTALNKFRSTLTDYRRSLDLIDKVKGKAGKNIKGKDRSQLAQLLGLPNENDLDMYSADDLEKMLTTKRNDIMDTVAADMQALFDQDLQQALKDNGVDLDKLEIPLEDIEIEVDSAGNVKVNTEGVTADVQAAIQQAVSAFYAQAGPLASMIFKVLGFGKGLKLLLEKGSGSVPKSGGGGGGGKSAAQKAIEQAKHNLVEYEHQLKMYQTAETKANNANDVSSFGMALTGQIDTYTKMAEVYRKNIADLEAQRSKLKSTEDDYWSLTDAINGYIEALEELGIKLTELNKKQIDFIEELQGYKKAVLSHTKTMYTTEGDYALKQEKYDEYRQNLYNQIGTNGMTIKQNEADIEEWKQQLARVIHNEGENSDNAQTIKQKIREKEEENASLTSENLDLYKTAENSRVDENQTKLDRALVEPKSNADYQNILKGIFGGREEFGKQRESIKSSYSSYEAMLGIYNSIIPELKKVVEDTEKGTPEWQNAYEAYQSALQNQAQTVADMDALIGEFDASVLTEIRTKFEDLLNPIKANIEVLSTLSDIYSDIEDYSAYRASLLKSAEGYVDMMNITGAQIDELTERLANMDKAADPTGYREVENELNEAKKAHVEYAKSILDTTTKIRESIVEEVKLAAARAAIIPQSEYNVAGTLGGMYKSNYDYDAYRSTIATQEASTAKLGLDTQQQIDYFQNKMDKGDYDDNPKLKQSVLEYLSGLKEKKASYIAQADTERKNRLNSYTEEIKNRTETELMGPNTIMQELQAIAARYQQNNDFEGYRAVMQQEIAVAQQMIQIYTEAIHELQIRMSAMEKGSPEWKAAAQQLNEFKVAVTKARIQIASASDEIQKSIINELLKKYQDALRGPKHNLDKASIYGNMYQGAKQYEDYRNMLAEQNSQRDQLIASLDQEIEELQQKATEAFGSVTYDTIVDNIYQKQTERDNYYAASVEARRAIDNSRADEYLENRQDEMNKYDRRITAYSTQARYYSSNKDDERYKQAIENQKQALKEKQEAEKTNLQTMIDLAAQLHTNTDGFKKLENQIYATAQGIADMDLELLNLEKEMQSMAVQEMLERIDRINSMDTHKINMLGTVRSVYEDNGELTNVNALIEKENELEEIHKQHIQEHLDSLNMLLPTLTEGSDEYWQAANAIMKYEEELETANATISKNINLLDENKKKILEVHKTAEDAVEKELEERVKVEEEMVASTANIQEKILKIIQQRYKDEWDVVKKDLEKKKEALNQEKSLINERLKARKDAMDQERDMEDLASLQQQLALISGDSSRTKEAKELRDKIKKMQQDMAMTSAENVLNNETSQIDDEIKAIDDQISFEQEKLDKFLEDSNNFKEEVDTLIHGSFEDLTEWIKKNDKAYKNSLEEGQENMLNSWAETWRKMKDIVRTYWDQVDVIMSSLDSYVEFFQGSKKYRDESKTGQKLVETEATERWTLYDNAYKTGAEFNHEDAFVIDQEKSDMDDIYALLVNGVAGLSPETLKAYIADPIYEANKIRHENYGGSDEEEPTEFEQTALEIDKANQEIKRLIGRAITDAALNGGRISDELGEQIKADISAQVQIMQDLSTKLKELGVEGVGNLEEVLGSAGMQLFTEIGANLDGYKEYILALADSIADSDDEVMKQLFDIVFGGYVKAADTMQEMATETDKKLLTVTDAQGAALVTTAEDVSDSNKRYATAVNDIMETMSSDITASQKDFTGDLTKALTDAQSTEAELADETARNTRENMKDMFDGLGETAGDIKDDNKDTNSQLISEFSTITTNFSTSLTTYTGLVESYTKEIQGFAKDITEALAPASVSDGSGSVGSDKSGSQVENAATIAENGAPLLGESYDVSGYDPGPTIDFSGNTTTTGSDGSNTSTAKRYAVVGSGTGHYVIESANGRYGTRKAAQDQADKLNNEAKKEAEKKQSNKNPKASVITGKPTIGIGKPLSIAKNDNGGLMDYTGLAWVDGTFSRPESFLDATDTEILRSMLDAFTYVKQSPYITRVDTNSYGNTTNIGDVNVTINQAELKDDADYEEVAKRVGQVFTKKLQKSGFNVTRYDL